MLRRTLNFASLCFTAYLLYSYLSGRGASGSSRWGYIDHGGAWKIEPQFDGADEFHEGLAAVRKDGKWGYIDATGNFAIEPQFSRAQQFSEGLAVVSKSSGDRVWETRFGYIDKTGAFVIPAKFARADRFSEGLATVCENNCLGKARTDKHGVIDRSGDYIIPPTFEWITPFSEGLAAATLDRDGPIRYGYIDRTGKVVIEAKWFAAGQFRQGLAATLSGYIDKRGQLVIPLSLDPGGHVGDFSDGLGSVSIGGDVTYYDASGRIALKAKRSQSFSEGFAAAFDNPWFGSPRFGFIDKSGKIAIPFRWGIAQNFSENLAGACDGCDPFN
ncbi:MAG: WG repeat-containing protein [Bryobacteraceae bacterium]